MRFFFRSAESGSGDVSGIRFSRYGGESFIALQLKTLTIAAFVGISIGVVPVLMVRRCGDLDLCLLLKAQASLGLTYWVSAVKTAFLWSVTHTLRRKASLALSLLLSRLGVAVA